jgi:hypothetical protein
MDLENQGNFILLPFRSSIRSGDFARWQPYVLAVLIVLIAHENRKTRLSFPSVKRIATLARVRKQRVGEAIESLAKSGWLKKSIISAPNGFERYEYTMLYKPYTSGDTAKWIWLPRSFVFDGVLGMLPGSVLKLYLTLHGLSWNKWFSIFDGTKDFDEPKERDRFVDISNIDPTFLSSVAGLKDSTRRFAWKWLDDHGLLLISQSCPLEDSDGVWLPDPTPFYGPKILDNLKKGNDIKKKKGTKGAKNILTRTRQRQKKKTALKNILVFHRVEEQQQ